MDKLIVLVTRVTGLIEQNRFVTDRQTDGQIIITAFRKTSIILCFRNVFFSFFCICNVLFLFISPEQNAQMNYCHY